MRLLAIECSTARASVALLENDELLGDQTWETAGARHENLVEHIARLMQRVEYGIQDIDGIAIGRGPGAYAGLRAALLAGQAIAAPSRIPVTALSSMDALALRLMREHETGAITMVGDARRNSIWLGACAIEEIQRTPTSWRIVPAHEAAGLLSGENLIATPHWPALENMRAQAPSANWIKESQHPTAIDVAVLARIRQEHHVDPEPLTPLYLHAAV